MKRLALSLLLLVAALMVQAQTIHYVCKDATYSVKADSKNITYSDDGQQITVLKTTINIADIDSIYIDNAAVDAPLSEFSFLKANTHVLRDEVGTIKNNAIAFKSPYIASANLIATFKANGKVYVDDVVQLSGQTENNFENGVTYRVVALDGTETRYTVTVAYSGLPVVEINTPNGASITSKTEWMEGATVRIINTDGTIDLDDSLSVKGRGNSTWNYVKKPYAMKLNKRHKVLGMKKHKRWVLLANWLDRTLMRNDIAFAVAQQTGLDWTPHGQFVELVLNGTHKGNYYLCEQVKVDKNRVNIAEVDKNTTDADSITGGYLMEIDTNYDELYKFHSSYMRMPWQFKDPDEVNTQQQNYVKNYVNSMEEQLYYLQWSGWGSYSSDYQNYIDINSAADYFLANDLVGNAELKHPKSCYMSKDINGKLKFGPVWDFDWGTFIVTQEDGRQATSSWVNNDRYYYKYLFNDDTFKQTVKDRWAACKDKFAQISDYIKATAEKIRHSEALNHEIFPVDYNVNGDIYLSFDEAWQLLLKNYEAKLKWMDSNIDNL